jgi:NADH-quinone oxidoreductase subunit C
VVLGARLQTPDLASVKSALEEALREMQAGPAEVRDEMIFLDVPRERFIEAAIVIRDHPATRCDFISLIAGIDTGERLGTATMVHGVATGVWVVVRTWCTEADPHLPTLVDVWPGANWHERETYDMFGIVFDGHPDLRRIFLEDTFPGHPLRKSFLPPRSDARGG